MLRHSRIGGLQKNNTTNNWCFFLFIVWFALAKLQPPIPTGQTLLNHLMNASSSWGSSHPLTTSIDCFCVEILTLHVPQGSVLEPRLFYFYTRSLIHSICSHGRSYNCCANDTQLNSSAELFLSISACLKHISVSVSVHHLQLRLPTFSQPNSGMIEEDNDEGFSALQTLVVESEAGGCLLMEW